MLFSKPLALGSPAPPFILPDEEGNVFVLNQQRGRNVLIIFYPADDTPVCTSQLCEVRDLWERLKEREILAVGVNSFDAAKHQRFKRKHNLPFPLLVDAGQRVAKMYRAGAPFVVRRTVYLVGKGGTIRYARRGKPPIEEALATAE